MSENTNTQWVLWLYDQIMGQIEPDLLSEEIPRLAGKYKDETSQEHKERMEAYAKAFKIFDEVFKEMSGGMYAEIEQLKKEAQRGRKSHEQNEKQEQLRSIEQSLDFSSDT
jgi:hypothetical protein